MERRLTTDIQVADLVVDVSNTAWIRTSESGPLDHPRLSRVAEGVDAYARWTNDSDLLVYAVADWSLARKNSKLPEEERLLLRRWYGEGLLEIHDCADERILEVASLTGIRVMSADLYRDFRRDHPWIQGNTDRFVKPVPDGGGGVTIEVRDMGRYEAWDLSICEELNLLKGQGLLRPTRRRPRREVLDRLWRCPEEDCRWFGAVRGVTQPVPRFASGRVICPQHMVPLTDVGPRRAAIQVKVKVHGEVRDRFVVTEGSPVVVGRSPGAGGYSLASWLDTEMGVLISRAHLVLAVENSALVVRDSSANGTHIESAAQGAGSAKTLQRGQSSTLGLGEEIVFEGGVSLIRSGRRFPYEMPDEDESHFVQDAGQSMEAFETQAMPTQWIQRDA